MGSASDEEAVQPTLNTLESLGVDYEVRVMSAHRTPERVHEYASTARGAGPRSADCRRRRFRCARWRAGRADHAARYRHPPHVQRAQRLGRPIVNGADAAGHSVAAMAVGGWGARNAAYYAAQILAIKHDNIREAVERYRQSLRG